MSYKRRRRTTYAWGEAKPNVYVVVACMAIGVGLIYCLFFPPDFTWHSTVKAPVVIAPSPRPNAPVAPAVPIAPVSPATAVVPSSDTTVAPASDTSAVPTNPPTPPIPAPPAVTPPAAQGKLGEPLRLPSPYPAPVPRQTTN